MTGGERIRCLICGTGAAAIRYRLYDDRYGYPGVSDVAGCENCGHLCTTGHLTDDEISRLYTEYYPRTYASRQDGSFNEFIGKGFNGWLRGDKSRAFRWVPENVRVLDIGCGYGNTMEYHRRRGCDVYGVELDEKAAALQSTFNVKVGPFDPADYQKDFFDFITLDQVVEHVPNPIAFIKDASEVLKPAGFIILSTPNAGGWGRKAFGAKWVHWHVPYHRHFFTRSSLGKAARACGLNVVRHETITDSLWLHFQWMHLLYYPSAGEPSEFWVKHLQGNTPRGERSGNRFTSVMWRRRINDCITRLFDMSGFGDNHLCVLQKQPLNHAQ